VTGSTHHTNSHFSQRTSNQPSLAPPGKPFTCQQGTFSRAHKAKIGPPQTNTQNRNLHNVPHTTDSHNTSNPAKHNNKTLRLRNTIPRTRHNNNHTRSRRNNIPSKKTAQTPATAPAPTTVASPSLKKFICLSLFTTMYDALLLCACASNASSDTNHA